ncbi:hypothetical protein [Candidatus Nitronereus thalassa]|uniref:Uncharacterized protein n=1 Tax=Candidatus Nitronereus thalassa TaxID=3020898 RepID=A0ABU3KCH5_9BACT|nr:hypothetical protein [Candidatus Nitronereus thalassa]MDT7044126.1 hypothetical protein [Candidatus Nitronereus thalassa]
MGSIRKATKVKASALMVGLSSVTLSVVNVSMVVNSLFALIGFSVSGFILTRPLSLDDQEFPAKFAVE